MKRIDLTVRPVDDSEQKAWDSLAGHPLQSWFWGKFRESMGVVVSRLGVFEGDKLVEGWQLTFHKIPHTSRTIGYFPKGPDIGQTMVSELTKLGKQNKAIFIQLEPNVLQSSIDVKQFDNLIPSHHPLFTKFTFLLDLTKSEAELLAAMHPKNRYNLKVAQKHGVTVKEDNSSKAFKAYLSLAKETTGRQGFYAHNTLYQQKMWETLSGAGIAKLFTATFEGEILSAWIVFVWKDTLYYPYGTSSRNHRDVMAPTLMLWEIAKWAKTRGLKYFDLWGALGPNPDTSDPWYGFHRFKQGFNPTLLESAGSFDLVISPYLYRLYTLADKIRWFILKLKTKFK